MRRSPKVSLLTDSEAQPVAINLGADFVAEHEWGIKRTYASFGVQTDAKTPGIGRRTNTTVPKGSLFIKECDSKSTSKRNLGFVGTLLIYQAYVHDEDTTTNPDNLRELPDYASDESTMSGAWSDGDFAIFGRSEEEQQFLRDLFEAFQNNDVAFWFGGGGFGNAGLCLGIASRLPEEIIEAFYDTDVAAADLSALSDATGIVKRLKLAADDAASASASGRSDKFKYFALSPRLAGKNRNKSETQHPVIYWLNPYDQQRVNFGWFTVEELDQWIDGTGPVLMSSKNGEAA